VEIRSELLDILRRHARHGETLTDRHTDRYRTYIPSSAGKQCQCMLPYVHGVVVVGVVVGSSVVVALMVVVLSVVVGCAVVSIDVVRRLVVVSFTEVITLFNTTAS